MRVSIDGLPEDVADGVADVLGRGGHERGEPAELAIVGIDPDVGTDLVDLPQGGWDAAVDAARASFFALQRAARTMVEHRLAGRIVVVVPVHALRTSRGCGLAAVAGSFLVTAAQVAAVELGPKGIRVNVLAVGPLEERTPARAVAAVPLGRLARATDLGGACRLLASPDAEYLTGAVIAVDGGYQVTKAAGGSPFSADG